MTENNESICRNCGGELKLFQPKFDSRADEFPPPYYIIHQPFMCIRELKGKIDEMEIK